MRCPFCSHEDTQVVETRDSDEGDVVRRRRIESPSSLTRESMTWVSSALQKGHFMGSRRPPFR